MTDHIRNEVLDILKDHASKDGFQESVAEVFPIAERRARQLLSSRYERSSILGMLAAAWVCGVMDVIASKEGDEDEDPKP